jgi:hypothetical protein
MIETAFGEEIEVGDEIMYVYEKYSSINICFGKVLEIELKEVRHFSGLQPRLHVHKTYEICQGSKQCDQKVILTNPTVFKCGTVLQQPNK